MKPQKSIDGESVEDYLMHRSRLQSSRGDRIGSRGWMLTAKLLHPNSFSIQFEAYSFEKSEKRERDAARLLSQMFRTFIVNGGPSDKYDPLWAEIDAVADMLQAGDQDSLLGKIFDHLPPSVGQEMLLKSASSKPDPLQKVRLYLVAFKKFPHLLKSGQHSVECLNILTENLSRRNMMADEKDVREQRELLNILVNEVLPLLFKVQDFKLDSIESVIHLMARYALDNMLQVHHRGESLFPTKWAVVLGHLEEIGARFNSDWRVLTDGLVQQEDKSPSKTFQKVLTLHFESKGGSAKFFLPAFLFIKHLEDYFDLSSQGPDKSFLVEGFVETQEASHTHPKRRRTTDGFPLITHFSTQETNPVLTSFNTAFKYYELLKGEYQEQLQAFMQNSYGTSCIPAVFAADVASFNGNHREAIKLLRSIDLEAEKNSGKRSCIHLKLASLFFCMNEHQSVGEEVIRAVVRLEESGVPDAKEEDVDKVRSLPGIKQATPIARHMYFLQHTKQSILSYGCKLLIHILKDKSLEPAMNDTKDLSLGHVIVLLQYRFPEDGDLLRLLLHRIKSRETFSYPLFCRFVIVVDVLEEFALLANSDSVNLILDVSSQAMTSQRRMGTRGANRGEKSEIRSLLKRQVQRCYENLDQLIIEFISTNRDTFNQCLM